LERSHPTATKSEDQLIDARKFARPNISPAKSQQTHYFRFGMNDAAGIAAELRRFADAIERGDYLMQKVHSGVIAEIADYSMQAIMFEFVEKETPATLYGGDSQFPVDVALTAEQQQATGEHNAVVAAGGETFFGSARLDQDTGRPAHAA
jgi:hypothetical protein